MRSSVDFKELICYGGCFKLFEVGWKVGDWKGDFESSVVLFYLKVSIWC